MLSTDLENLANALEQLNRTSQEDNTVFIELFCCNLHSLAQRVNMLEAMAVAPVVDIASQESEIPLQ